MRYSIACTLAVVLMFAGIASAEEKSGSADAKVRRTVDGHPDLSGIWSFAISLPPEAIKKVVNGKVSIEKADQSARHGIPKDVSGASPWTQIADRRIGIQRADRAPPGSRATLLSPALAYGRRLPAPSAT